LPTPRIANATIDPEDHDGFEITPEMTDAGVSHLRREVLALVESEPVEFENTIRELVAVMLEARQRPRTRRSGIARHAR
jgi:hypothetical protein